MTADESFHPLVTIVIPVYNGSIYLREAIDSALSQTYDNIEVLVVNDGSNDGGETEEIAHSYGDRIRYFKKENGGVATALNLAIKEMRGEYFSWLSHDDLYDENKINLQVNLLGNQNNRIQVVYSDCEIFNERSGHREEIIAGSIDKFPIRYHLTIKSTIHGCSLLIPKAAFDKIGSFNEDLRYTQDYEMWYRIGGEIGFLYLPKILVKSRRHPSQDSSRYSVELQKQCDYLRCIFIKNLTETDFPKDKKRNLVREYVRLHIDMYSSGYIIASIQALRCARSSAKVGVLSTKIINYAYIYLMGSGVTNFVSRILKKAKLQL